MCPTAATSSVSERGSGFVLFCIATFLSFLGTSSISYFSVVFSQFGMSQSEIGLIFSSALVPAVLGILLCGELLNRFTSLQLVITGEVVTLLSFASFLFTISHPIGAAVSRFLAGAGFGLFFPAALIYARSLISGPNAVFLFGIYSTMIPLPNLIGPGLAELIFASAGATAMICAFVAPISTGLVISLCLPKPGPQRRVADQPGYWQIISDRSAILPNSAIAMVGLMWGFMLSFMALYLHRAHVPATTFFSSATGAMVVSRFTVMAWLGRWPRHLVAGLGLILMACGYAALALASPGVGIVVGSALVFGLGYSTAFPVLSLWATDGYPAAQRGRPMAVFTASFQASIFVVPFIVGLVGGLIGIGGALLSLAAASGVFGLWLVARRSSAAE